MNKMLIFLLTAGLLLTPGLVYAQPDQASAKAPISQPLVREGDFALKLAEALKVGKASNEAEAESMLTTAGIAPKNGWIADYPVTPDIIGELQKAVSEAADAQKLPLGKEEALKTFRTASAEVGLPVVGEVPGNYPETQPQYAESSGLDDYYSGEGPPVVTYYPPPPDYGYLYAWVPFPFFFNVAFFPGFFILHDFNKIIIVNRRVVVVSNHFIDPKTRTVASIDPVKRGTGKGFLTTLNRSRMGFTSAKARQSAASIFERSRQRMASTRSSMRAGIERGRMTSGTRGMPERSFRGSERSFGQHSMGGRGSFGGFHGGFHGGGFSRHGGR